MDLRSLNFNYNDQFQRMNWPHSQLVLPLHANQQKPDFRQTDKMPFMKEKVHNSFNGQMMVNHLVARNLNQPVVRNLNQPVGRNLNQSVARNLNQPVARSVSMGVQTDLELMDNHYRNLKNVEPLMNGEAPRDVRKDIVSHFASAMKNEKGHSSLMNQSFPHPLVSSREDAPAIVPYRPNIGSIPDYDRSFVPRFPMDDHPLATLNHHPQIKGEGTGNTGAPGPYYGETDFDTNYCSKLMSAFLIQDCNSLRTFKEQAGTAYFNGNDVAGDVRNKPPNGFDMRGPAYPFYNDASSIFSNGPVSNGENGSKVNENYTINRKPNAILRLGGEEVTCEVCGKKFPHIWLLKIHSTVHTGRELKACDICNKAFVQAFGNINRRHQRHHNHNHHSHHHDDQNKSLLSPCSSTTSSLSSVSPGVAGGNGTAPTVTHPCDLCNRLFTTTVRQSHENGIGKMYSCDVCNRSYSTLGNLKQHKEKHYGDKAYTCDDCHKSFFTSGNLKQHMVTHTGEKTFLCKICDKTYSTSGNLRQHMMTHTGQKTNFCVICSRSFSTLGNLKQHMLTHFAANLYPCEICKKSYSTLGNLKQHTLTHSGQRAYSCDKCDKTFTTLGNAKQHTLRHSGEKPYVCQTCGKSFFTLGNLKQHTLTHSEEKLYKCDKCTKSFYTLSNLKQHLMTHSDQKKTYVCEVCDRSFSTYGNLKQHKLKHL